MKYSVILTVKNGKHHECFLVNKYPPCWQGLQQVGIRLLAMNFMTLTLTTVLHGCFDQTIDILERLPQCGDKLKQRTLHRSGEGERVEIPWARQRGRLTKTHHVGHRRQSAGQTFQIIVLANGFAGRAISMLWLIIFMEGHLYICNNEHQLFKAHIKSQLFNQGRTPTPVPLSTEKLKARAYISNCVEVNYMQRNHSLSSSWTQ